MDQHLRKHGIVERFLGPVVCIDTSRPGGVAFPRFSSLDERSQKRRLLPDDPERDVPQRPAEGDRPDCSVLACLRYRLRNWWYVSPSRSAARR